MCADTEAIGLIANDPQANANPVAISRRSGVWRGLLKHLLTLILQLHGRLELSAHHVRANSLSRYVKSARIFSRLEVFPHRRP